MGDRAAARKRRRDAATYGVFGEDEDAARTTRPALGLGFDAQQEPAGRGGLGLGADLSGAGMGGGMGLGGGLGAPAHGGSKSKSTRAPAFVSAGVARPQQDDATQQQKTTEKEPEGARGGLGFARGGGGGGEEEAEEEAPSVLPSAFGARIKERAERRREREDTAARAAAERLAVPADTFAGVGAGAGLGAAQGGGKQERGGVGGGGAPRGGRGRRTGAAADEVGAFEAHTKGIGAKLLAKMGWRKGEGIGRGGGGIAKPIETHLRPKGMGLGAGGFDEQRGTPARKRVDGADDEAEGAEAGAAGVERAKPRGMWQQRAAPKRAKDVYKTAEEVLADAQQQGGTAGGAAAAPPGLKVIDMRGPSGPREVSDLEQLHLSKLRHEDVPMPELQHNVRLVVDVAESKIRELERARRKEEQAAAAYAAEAARAHDEREAADAEHSRAAALLAALDARERLVANAAGGHATDEARVAAVAKFFAALRTRFAGEFAAYDVARVAIADALAPAQRLMHGWAPLEDPARGAHAISALRRVLVQRSAARDDAIFFDEAGDSDGEPPRGSDAAYSALLEAAALPALRSAVTNPPPRGWDPRQPESLLVVLEAWRDALPAAALDELLTALVLPKLERELSAASAGAGGAQQQQPLHAWLHPWLPWLGGRMEPLWEPVRRGLERSLEGLENVDDPAVRAALVPWRAVLGRRAWASLLARGVAPKLAFALEDPALVLASQDGAEGEAAAERALRAVLAWAEDMPLETMASLLQARFFPRWLRALHAWLLADPDLDDVSAWYMRWKEMLPEDLAANEAVRRCLNAALDMMNAAVADAEGFAASTAEQFVPAAQAQAVAQDEGDATAAAAAARQQRQQQPRQQHKVSARTHASHDVTFKDLVASFAEEHGLLLQPKAGRLEGGLQVYSMGTVSVTLDTRSERLQALIGGRWVAASLTQVLEESQRRQT